MKGVGVGESKGRGRGCALIWQGCALKSIEHHQNKCQLCGFTDGDKIQTHNLRHRAHRCHH